MNMVAILVMSPKQFEQAFVPSSQGDSTLNVASISQVVIEEKKFKNIESEWFGPMNDLDLWYSWSFMYSFRWLHLPTFIS